MTRADAALNDGANCGGIQCRGAGKCVANGDHFECICDEGYKLVDEECIVDEECVRLRLLEPGCRQRLGAEPALAMLFGVETCAGTTVRPEILGNAETAFKVLEDGNQLGSESYATVLPRDVESYVAITLDMSSSVAGDAGLLTSLIAALKGLVQDLAPGAGESKVSVALIVFGRSVDVVLPFTSDFAAVQTKLDEMLASPDSQVTDPNGTNLNGAVNRGIEALNQALQARFIESGGGVVATGTVLSVTDGNDTSGVKLQTDQRYNFISIGISDDIDDVELTKVGTQGSFLAPRREDWEQAFAHVAERVAEYPKRSHLLAYCSPAVDGKHTVAVTLASRQAAANATCEIDAQEFGVGQVCDAAFISGYCADAESTCRSFLACQACGADAGAPAQGWAFTN